MLVMLSKVRLVMAASLFVLSSVATADAEEAGQSYHEHDRHKIELGISNTHTEHGENAFTMAASYNYRFSESASIGVLTEYAFDPLETWILGVPLKIYPGAGWVLTAMPAAEIHDSHSEPLFRLGVGYEFEIEGTNSSLSPEFNVDWVDDEVNFVIGLSLGFGF